MSHNASTASNFGRADPLSSQTSSEEFAGSIRLYGVEIVDFLRLVLDHASCLLSLHSPWLWWLSILFPT
jgi:hypothetical protein